MEEKDLLYMQEAFKEAVKAMEAGEVPVGCVITEGTRIVARAHNMVETLHDATAHAEMIALTQAAEHRGDWRLTEMTLYVTLEPCSMCAGAVILSRIRRVVFGAVDLRAGAAGSTVDLFERLKHIWKMQVEGGLMAEESTLLLREFFRQRRTDRNGTKR